MNYTTIMGNAAGSHLWKPGPTLRFLILLIMYNATAFAQDTSQPANSPLNVRATHVLGFEGAKTNATGTLSIQDTALQFQKSGKPAVQVQIASVQDVCLGQRSGQIGGLPMTLGKAAAPYGGGRLVSLLAHKKYDTLTVEYTDSDGGFHGAMFQLNKGQGEVLRNALISKGAHIADTQPQPKQPTALEVSNESK